MKPIKYITENQRDPLWGLTICSVGHQQIDSHQVYPPKEHDSSYLFNPQKGRVLSEYQLVYIIAGSGELETRHVGRREVHAGQMFLIFPGEWHTYQPRVEVGWNEYWIGFKGANIDHRVEEHFFSVENPIYNIGINAEIINLYEQAIETATHQRAYFQQLLAGIVNHMLGLVFMMNYNRNVESITPDVPQVIDQARTYMQHVIEENVSMPQVAEHLNQSYATFRHMFKKYTGLSPAQYFINLRLFRAKELLRSSDCSIKEISYRLHFENPEYFATLFKRRTGITPTDFRKG